MNCNLTQSDLDYIINTIKKFNKIKEAKIFGSRALGTNKPGSDVDIAIIGEEIDFSTVSKLHALLEEESPMPYTFDVIDYSHLEHKELKDHIDRVGVRIFP